MVKAQSFFGGTSTKNNTTSVKQVGHTGKVQSKTTSLPIRETVKQARPVEVGTEVPQKVKVKQVGIIGERA